MAEPAAWRTGGFLLLLSWALLVPPAAGGGFANLASRIDAPRVGEPVQLEKPIQLQHGTITPAPGTKVFRLMAGQQACGLFVDGPAHLEIKVVDPFSVPVARRNLKRASSLEFTEVEDGLVVREELKSALVWNWFLANTPAVEGAQDSGRSIPEWATEVLQDPYFVRPGMELLTSFRLRVPGAVFALLEGKRGKWILQRDPVGDLTESLLRVRRPEANDQRDRFFSQNLVSQPLDRAWWDRFPAALVAERERIEVDNPEGKVLTISTTSKLRATQDHVGGWRANLVSSLYFQGRRYQNVVQSVQVEGEEAEFIHRDDQLLVILPKPLAKGETVTVRVVNAGEFAFRPQGDNFWSLGTWSWYPQPDLNGELAKLEIRVRVPKEYTPFASGSEILRTTEGEYSIIETSLGNPMQFPVVAAGNYEVFSETRDGITCRVATYAGAKKDAAQRLINNFFAAAEYYNHIFGIPYPFTDFTIIERNTWGFGQAPPGVIFITKEAFDSVSDTTSRLFSQGINERVVHEVAHAWWGHVIKMDSLEEQWLTESFASYSAALCLQQMFSKKRGQQEFKSLLKYWQGQAEDIDDGGSIYLANYLAFNSQDDSFTRRSLLYHKGPVVLHALRQELGRQMGGAEEGDKYFFAFIRSFLKSFEFHWGGTRHVVGILNELTKKDWQPWFEKYVYGFELPEIQL